MTQQCMFPPPGIFALSPRDITLRVAPGVLLAPQRTTVPPPNWEPSAKGAPSTSEPSPRFPPLGPISTRVRRTCGHQSGPMPTELVKPGITAMADHETVVFRRTLDLARITSEPDVLAQDMLSTIETHDARHQAQVASRPVSDLALSVSVRLVGIHRPCPRLKQKRKPT